MIDLIKKTLYAGLGLAFMTKEKIEEVVKELVEKGKMTEKEARDYLEDLLVKSKEARKHVENQIENTVKTSLKKMNLVTRDEYEKLEKRLKEAEKKLKETKR